MIRTAFQSALCLLLAPLLIAQQAVEPPSANYRPQSTAMINEVVIPKGTRIDLVSLENVSSATTTENSVVRFALAKDLVVNDVTVLEAGALVEGRVSRVRRGVPYRKWGKLSITIRKMHIGNHAHVRLISSDPESPESKVDEWTQCVMVFPWCIAMIIGFSQLGHASPGGNNEQAYLSSCASWTLWTGSDFKVSDRDIAEGKTALSGRSPSPCTNVRQDHSRGQVQVK